MNIQSSVQPIRTYHNVAPVFCQDDGCVCLKPKHKKYVYEPPAHLQNQQKGMNRIHAYQK